MAMNDDDIYAYEHEIDEMDEWEQMHAHEMEAAEDELRAMEAAERTQKESSPQTELPLEKANPVNLDDRLAHTQARLDAALERCATMLGETETEVEMEDTEMLDDYVVRKQKASTLDAATSQFLLARPPIDSDTMSIVLPSGERRFLRKRALRMEPQRKVSPDVTSDSLLPIAELMEALEQKQIEKLMRKDADDTIGSTSTSFESRDTALWLDKYKPNRFVDLLSDERTNREVLAWIKQWDTFVFPGKKAYNPTWTESDENQFVPGAGSNRLDKSGLNGDKAKWHADENDPRPREKIILLCGPPGAGKTTLANIVARHAGYNPIEINASDDRTTGVLKNKIINAMEMQSIWGDQKPNCIILDEIDGAMNGGDGKSAIAAIQEIISTPLHLPKDRAGKKTSRNSSKHPLTRPLICICNDQFASVLRPLRKLAKIFVLDTPNSQRLVSRLKVICRDEGLKSSTGALATLSTNGGNDIRYCVNALQFQSTRTKHITSTIVSSGLVGQKDHSRGIFEMLDMVFFQTAKAKASSVLSQTALEQIDEAAHSLGNNSLLINALDENVPRMIFNDPTMNKICDAFEWLGTADSWDHAIRADQQFALTAFIPFAARAVHLACCTSSRRRSEYPKTPAEAAKKRDKTVNILQAFGENSQLHPSLRANRAVLVLDVVPWLMATLSPNIRHAAPNLQSPDEKDQIQRVIELMSSLGLSFRPKFLADGSQDYALEPALHEVGVFQGADSHHQSTLSSHVLLPLAVRKMIAREVELEDMRKQEASEQSSIKAKSSLLASRKATQEPAAKPMTAEAMAKQFVLPELTAQEEAVKMEAIRKRNPFAFAHREAKRKRTELEKASGDSQGGEAMDTDDPQNTNVNSKRPSVRYRYNEGYTSGIKTPVYIRDLL